MKGYIPTYALWISAIALFAVLFILFLHAPRMYKLDDEQLEVEVNIGIGEHIVFPEYTRVSITSEERFELLGPQPQNERMNRQTVVGTSLVNYIFQQGSWEVIKGGRIVVYGYEWDITRFSIFPNSLSIFQTFGPTTLAISLVLILGGTWVLQRYKL